MNNAEFMRLQERAKRMIQDFIQLEGEIEEVYGLIEDPPTIDPEYLKTKIEIISVGLTSMKMSFVRLWARVESAKTG